MNKVDILDLIKLDICQPIRGHVQINVEAIDKTKNVVFDEKALKELNIQLTQRVAGMDVGDPRAKGFIKEFTGRMVSELYRNGLVEIEEVKDAKEDPYEEAKKKYGRRP